jgi:arylsulfatase A-like enzyme
MNGMAAMLDQGVTRVVTALHATGLWNNTLLIFSAVPPASRLCHVFCTDSLRPCSRSCAPGCLCSVRLQDNGGWVSTPKLGGNNWPLRGGKVTDFEGGVRTNAFVAGGLIPDALRNSSTSKYVHVTDW